MQGDEGWKGMRMLSISAQEEDGALKEEGGHYMKR